MTEASSFGAIAPQNDVAQCALSWAAKVVCSSVFVTGRDPDEAFRHSAAWMLVDREALRRSLAGKQSGTRLDVRIEVDRERRSVTLVQDGVRRASARIHGDQGAVIVREPEAALHFEPTPVPIGFRDATTTPWPRGDLDAESTEAPPELRHAAERATELVFENPRQQATAFLVVYRGRIVAERYGKGADRETRLDGWSMGKTIGVALAGRMMALGGPGLDQDHLFPEWSDDPIRASIRLQHLLQLSSGLSFSGSYGGNEDPALRDIDGVYLDHIYVYAGGIDSYSFCASKPSEHPPGTVGRYRNCDPLLTMRVLRDWCRGRDEDFLTWPQRNLFDRLGMTGMTLETDPASGFLVSGHDYGRARDWARIGLLLLGDGVWNGERLLPEGFVDFVRAPAPAWAERRGACVVRNFDHHLALPRSTYWASGAGVNKTIVVPSLDLVIVKLSHISGRVAGELGTLNEALREISLALGYEPPPASGETT